MSAAILPFPPRNKGRKRHCRSMEAAGFLSMMLLERDGEAIPDNVQRLDEPQGTIALPTRTDELLFATLIWGVLTPDQRDSILSTLRCMAYGKSPDACALRLYNALSGRARKC